MPQTEQVQVTDGMIIEWDVPIEMDDGLRLRADIFRPIGRDPTQFCCRVGPMRRELAFKPPTPQRGTAWPGITRR
jgi:hypothetical protein